MLPVELGIAVVAVVVEAVVVELAEKVSELLLVDELDSVVDLVELVVVCDEGLGVVVGSGVVVGAMTIGPEVHLPMAMPKTRTHGKRKGGKSGQSYSGSGDQVNPGVGSITSGLQLLQGVTTG